MIGQTISHYRVLEKLGEGGMGVVYVGEDTLLRRRVAIKTLTAKAGRQEYRIRFLREAQAVSTLSHPHIAAVYDYGETPEGVPFIIMELVEGQTLDQLMRGSSLTISRAVGIIEGVVDALSEAHRHNIIHRDIKPSNIAIGGRGEVKVLDFGLAKQVGADLADADVSEAQSLAVTQTREGVVIGTPLYLSPEQALGMRIDTRSDIFSLGSLLYECVAGRPAFPGVNAVDICAKVIRDDPQPPSCSNPVVPVELDRIILKALAKRPEERYQSAGELLGDLRAVSATLDGEALVPPRPLSGSGMYRAPGQVSITDMLRRPRYLAAVFIGALVLGILPWVAHLWRSSVPLWKSPEAEKRYAEGVGALRDGTYNKARKLFADAVTLDGQSPLAHAGLAEALSELDDTRDAEREITLARSLAAERRGLSGLNQLSLDATDYLVRRNLDAAVRKYQEILQLIPDGDRAGKAQAYVDLGRAWEKKGNAAKSLENYEAAAAGEPLSAAAFLRQGIIHSLLSAEQSAGAAELARGELDRAEALYETSSNYEGVTEVLLQRGSLYAQQGGDAGGARAQFLRARDIARTATSNVHQEIRALLSLSGIAATEGKTDEAKGYAGEAVNTARATGLENLTVQGLIDLGNVFFLRREYDSAEAYLKQALELAHRYGEDSNEARAQLFLAKLYVQKEQLDEGLSYAERSLDFYRRAGYGRETTEVLLLNGRGKLLKGDYEGALRSFDEAIETARRMQDAVQTARSHAEVGFLLASREFYPAALRHYEASYELNRSLDDPRRTAYSLLSRGDMLWRLGHDEEAATALSQASVVAGRIEDDYRQLFLARVFLTGARMELSRRNFPEAVRKAESAGAQAGTKIQYAAIEVKSTLGLARALSGEVRRGVSLCRQAVEQARAASFSAPPLVGGVLLALADAELEAGDARGALRDALEAQDTFARDGQPESECRAHLTAARALQRLRQLDDARAHLARAGELLSALQRDWGADFFYTYIARPDLRASRDPLVAALARP